DAEIGGGVRAGAGAPLPTAVVRGHVAVDEFVHEITLAPLPVDEEILGQEHRHDHAEAVVHPAGGVQAAHGGVHDGIAGHAGAPRVEVRAIVVPTQCVVFRSEAAAHD